MPDDTEIKNLEKDKYLGYGKVIKCGVEKENPT